MFGLACKGLHCAGCGRGIPAFIVALIIVFIAASDKAISGAIEIAAYAIAGAIAFAAIGTMAFLHLFMRKGPAVVYVKTDRLTYGEMKYLESGDTDYLALTGGQVPQIAPRNMRPVIRGDLVRYMGDR
jgi:hypothetical protein